MHQQANLKSLTVLNRRSVELSILAVFLVVLSSFTVMPHVPSVKAQNLSGTTLQVFSWDYSGSLIVDPARTPGSVFILDIYATNIPAVIDANNGGINAFAIDVTYDSTILKATGDDINPPICASVNDICLFSDSQHSPTAIPLPGSCSSATGCTGMGATIPANTSPPNYNRVSGSGTIFAMKFQVVGVGFTNVTIDQSSSYLVGISGGSVTNQPYKKVDLSFENRQPYNIRASPPSGFVAPGQSTAANVTAVQVWTVQSFTEGLHFSISGLPTGTVATFNPVNSTGALPFTTRLNITTSTGTPNGAYPLNITAVSNMTSVRRSTIYTLTVATVDLAVTSVAPQPTVVVLGDFVFVVVGVANHGAQVATFTVNLFANATQLATQRVTLSMGGTGTVNFSWNTTGFSNGNYMITARIPPVPGETNLSNNNMTVGPVRLTADFRVFASPTGGDLGQTQSTSIQVTVANITSATEQVSLSVTGLPSGVTSSFNSQSGLPRFTSTLRLDASSTATAGPFTLNIVGTSSAGIVRMASFSLTVVYAHDVVVTSIVASSAVVNPGQNVIFTVTVVNNGLYKENLTIDVLVTPSGGSSTTVGTATVVNLLPGVPATRTVTWNTASYAMVQYNFKANVPPVPGETNIGDNTLTGSGTLRINVPPTPSFTPPSTTPEIGQTIAFDASSSTDSDGGAISTYSWSFGDGSTGTGKIVTHQYAASGNYTVTLTVTDNDGGASKSFSHSVRANAPPTAAFTPSTTTLQIGQTVTFDATSSSDSDGTISTYTWDFGDGTPTAIGKTVTHTYASAQAYTVKLTVTDNDGATTIASQTVTVTPAPSGTSLLTSAPFLGGIAAAILIAVGGLLYLRRRKTPVSKTAPAP